MSENQQGVPQVSFSERQEQAIDDVSSWLQASIDLPRSDRPQPFRLFGYAGTGKTTLAKEIARRATRDHGLVCFAAYTGKAASVLRKKGCYGASTIHSLIYHPKLKDGRPVKPMEWTRSYAAIEGSALIIIDECSMVGQEIGQDLIDSKIPILVLGDPAQLPPIGGGGFFTNGEPDVLLTEIHRQQDGSGIIDIATAARNKQRLAIGQYNESRVAGLHDLRLIDPFDFDQVIVGRNSTRRFWNARMRQQLGHSGVLPVPGDKLICLRNNRNVGIMNGEIVHVIDIDTRNRTPGGHLRVTVQRDETEKPWDAVMSDHYFLNEGDAEWLAGEVLFFDYGYAITAHKSQGSQWPRVLVIDESRVFRESAAKWLYTAVTRAAEHVTVVQ